MDWMTNAGRLARAGLLVPLALAGAAALAAGGDLSSSFGRAQNLANSFEARMQSLQRNSWSARGGQVKTAPDKGGYAGYQPLPQGIRIADVEAWTKANPDAAALWRRDAILAFARKTYTDRGDRAQMGLQLVEEDRGPVELDAGWTLIAEAADNGHALAAAYLATAAYYGHKRGQPVDNVKAARYATLAVQGGSSVAKYVLGRLAYFGDGMPRDTARAAQLLREAATGTPPVEQALLDWAQIRAAGLDGQPADRASAIKALRDAEATGSPALRLALGRMLYRDDEAGQSDGNRQAYELVRRAAEGGDADGQHTQALWLLAGRGVAADVPAALAMLEKAADAGSAAAMVTLGNLHGGDNRRYGLTKDVTKSFQWLERAAKAGSDEGLYLLSAYYHAGGPVPKDTARAAELVRQAAERGHALSRIRHGINLLESGDAPTVQRGVAYLEGLAGNGNVKAMSLLGQAVGLGVPGLPANAARGRTWLRKAAEAGDGAAMHQLSQYIEKGQMGFEANTQQAIEWRVKAAEAGHAEASFAAAWVHIQGLHGFPVDFAKANRFLAQAGPVMPFATHILAVHTYRGQGTPKNEARAFELWRDAARRGEETAQSILKQNNLSW
jgi:hypothetical protein